jgi:hypothetical protein
MRQLLHEWLKRIALGALALLAPIVASPASAQVYLYDPGFPSGPIEASDPIVGLALPGATPAEYRAHLLWQLRSGLNVSALQCQFSPYLRTVDNYNSILAHHSRELASAYQALEGYFRRVHGREGPRRFDDYSTQTYNNFSTRTGAQLGFCQTASRVGREALATRKGDLNQLATARVRELRSSLTPSYENYTFTRAAVRLAPISLIPDCTGMSGREKRQCESDLREMSRAARAR